ncbi:MAG: hypothetical protein HUU23_16620 [Caldilineales bacterium]|nr:hypothetical protein [Caldilineales bacterium]
MGNLDQTQPRHARQAPHDLSPEQFRALGRQVVDQIADFLASLPGRPVAPGAAPAQVRAWQEELHRLGASGDYFFSLNRYLFLARR